MTLQLQNWLRYFNPTAYRFGLDFLRDMYSNMNNIEYHKSYSFKEENIFDVEWMRRQKWGEYHPEYLYQYYDKDAVILFDNELYLNCKYKPVNSSSLEIEGKFIDNGIIDYSVGLITSNVGYGYGFYQFKATLPKTPYNWSAIWFHPIDAYPPEIDLVEIYSGKDGKFRNDSGLENVMFQSNFHLLNLIGERYNLESMNHPIKSIDEPVLFQMWLAEDFIKIYYNGYLVRVVDDINLMRQIKRFDKYMIIINNALVPDVMNVDKVNDSNFIIHSIDIFETKLND